MEKSKSKIDSGAKLSYICKVCGKQGNIKGNMKDHIEANHLEGVIIPCNRCEKTFRYRTGLRLHKCIETPQQTNVLKIVI